MNKEQAALLPKMTGGDPVKQAAAFEEANKEVVAAQPVSKPSPAPAPMPAPSPAPRQSAPELKEYWIDDRGNIWRKTPVPTIILIIKPELKQPELDRVMRGLLEQ